MARTQDRGWTRSQYREAFIRAGFIALLALMAFVEWAEESGSPAAIGMTVLAAAYIALNVAAALARRPFLYSAGRPYLTGALDLTAVLLLIELTGGAASRGYLLLGAAPFIAAVYAGERGFWLSLIAVLGGYSAVLFADAGQMQPGAVGPTWAVRYAYLAGAWLTAGLVSGRLRQERRRRQVTQVPREAAITPALPAMVSDLCAKTARLLGCRVCFVLFPEAGGSQLAARYPGVGLPYEAWAGLIFEPVQQGALAAAYLRREPQSLYGSALEAPELAPLRRWCQAWDMMLAPLASRERRLGVLVAADKRRGFFQQEDLEELAAIASEAAIYLDNASLYLSSEEAVARLNSLMASVTVLGPVTDVDELCGLGHDLLKAIFDAEAIELAVKEPERQDFRCVRGFGFDVPLSPGECDQALVCREVEQGECPLFMRRGDTRAAACIPLRAGGRDLGVIRMAGRSEGAFTDDDIYLAQALAEQLAMALERAFLFERVNRLAVTDELTGLYNIRQLSRVVSDEMRRASRYGRSFSFMMLDIDLFKPYNDRNGHLQGNRLLAELAGLMIRVKRDVDSAFRYGGEEFSLVLPEVGKREAFMAAERLRRAVEEHDFPGGEEQPGGRLTVSIGVASYPDDAEHVGALMEAADQALYLAKARGRNRSEIYRREPEDGSEEHREDRSWPRSA